MKLFDRQEVWEIGPFQLENLLMNEGKFLYFYLGSTPPAKDAGEAVLGVLSACENLPIKEVEKVVGQRASNLEHPVILVCENGDRSRKAARRLAKLKYTNVYVVAGGVESLVRYFADSE